MKRAPLSPALLFAAAALALPGGPACAQAGRDGADGIMTREELRVCIARETALKARRADYEAQKAALDADRVEAKQAADDSLALRAAVQAQGAQVRAMNQQVAALGSRIEAFNARVTATRDQKPSEEEREALVREEQAIKQEADTLEAERRPLQARYEQAVSAYNASAAASDRRVGEWNERSTRVADRGRQVEAERVAWVADCGNRRYREEDAKAIRAGL